MTKSIGSFVGFVLLLILSSTTSAQTGLAPTITDVTPSGFSVVWSTAAPNDASLSVFTDPSATNEVTGAYRILAYPLIGTDLGAADPAAARDADDALIAASQGAGLVKIRVEGVVPGSNLFVHPQSQGVNLLTVPLAVTTEDANSFISASNQLLVRTLDGRNPGAVVTVSSGPARNPVSAIIGDGAPSDTAFINLNHLFDGDRSNWQPVGPTQLTITVAFNADNVVSSDETISFTGDFTVGQSYLIDLGTDTSDQPSITLIDPATPIYSQGGQILISWTDDTAMGSGTVSLFADTDNTGEDGTSIVAGLDGQADGVADRFTWDPTGFSDGQYFVYAVIDNGSKQATSYSTAQVTIDKDRISADGDPMSDLFEDFYFGDRSRDGSGDFDDDGESDAGEAENNTDPRTADIRLSLSEGLNIISFPFNPTGGLTASDVIFAFLPNVSALSRVNPNSGLVEAATFDGEVIGGVDFPILAGEGYFVETSAAAEGYFAGNPWDGSVSVASAEVAARGFKGTPDAYDAFTLLQSLGGSSVVESVRGYDPVSGRYQTAAYYGASAIGENFPIHRGQAYLIAVRSNIADFTP